MQIFGGKTKGSKVGKGKSFSVEEKRAHDAGKAYAAAKKGKRVKFKTKKEEASFRNGYNAVKGGKK